METLRNIDVRLESALEHHRLGLRLVPLRGKIALVRAWQHLHLAEREIVQWGRSGVNWGAITGDPVCVIDTDNDAAESWVKAKRIESSVEVISGGGGRHRWFTAINRQQKRGQNR